MLAGHHIYQRRFTRGSRVFELVVLRNCSPRKLGVPRYVDRGGGYAETEKAGGESLSIFGRPDTGVET